MQKYRDYATAEKELINRIIGDWDFNNQHTFERINDGFILTTPLRNKNDRSNYDYALEFFKWMMSGEKQLSQRLLEINPWVGRFTTEDGLPPNFSASYGWKIHRQMPAIIREIQTHKESRRAYMNILFDEDSVIREVKTTHEYPCTLGLHWMQRGEELHLIVNMRSNNCIKVMPYDVYNFTMLQAAMAESLDLQIGNYYHQINSAHVFKGDARRWIESPQYEAYGSK